MPPCFGEGYENLVRKSARETVDPTRDGVLFVKEGRNLERARSEHGWSARVTADAQDRPGTQIFEYGVAASQSFEKEEAGAGACYGSAREPREGQDAQVIACFGNEVSLYTSGRADKLDGGSPCAQFIRHAKRGDRVSPGSAAGDQDPGRALRGRPCGV